MAMPKGGQLFDGEFTVVAGAGAARGRDVVEVAGAVHRGGVEGSAAAGGEAGGVELVGQVAISGGGSAGADEVQRLGAGAAGAVAGDGDLFGGAGVPADTDHGV